MVYVFVLCDGWVWWCDYKLVGRWHHNNKMNNYQQQSMQNWKKEIIMDQYLNPLFNNAISPQQFLYQHLLTLTSPTLIHNYVKLTSLKHAITKNIHKEIQTKHNIIQTLFEHNYAIKHQYESINHEQLKGYLKNIQKFNEKYEYITQKTTQWDNLNKILHFSRALEKFKVNVRLLHSLMKDFDQNSHHKILAELLNTIKISKILKEISNIMVKFDFSGIKSYEEERVFINNTRGAIYGLIQKDLTGHLLKIPAEKPTAIQEIMKDILNKINILNNINKFKDFFLNFYRNTLKEMSQLCKKCLTIGQSSEQKDVNNMMHIFQEYFSNSLHRKIVENSIIFIVFEEVIQRNNIKVAFSSNFYEKYWENLVGFLHDLLTWSIENDGKEIARQKSVQNLYESFLNYESKGSINRYLSSITWKYPIIYHELASIINEVHLYLIKHVKFHHYDFSIMKQQLIKEIIPLSSKYYRHAENHFISWTQKITKLSASLQNDEEKNENFPLNVAVHIFQNKADNLIGNNVKILEWLLSFIRTDEIYQFYLDHTIAILDDYQAIFKKIMNKYDQKYNRDNFLFFIAKWRAFHQQIRRVLARHPIDGANSAVNHDLYYDESKVLLGSTSSLLKLIGNFRGYEFVLDLNQKKIKSNA